MMRVGITGYTGFVATHLRLLMRYNTDVEVVLIPRSTLNDTQQLLDIVSGCDVLIHLATINRGPDEEVYATNVQLAQNIVDACHTASVKPHVLFASSIYADPSHEVPAGRSQAFGPSKKAVEDLFLTWGEEVDAKVTIFRLPHVFGEMAKPHHNSAVATFCHELAHGKNSTINAGAQTELVYVGEVVSRLYRAVREGENGIVHILGVPIGVDKVYEFLKKCTVEYRDGNMPPCSDSLHTALFLTLHSHILRSYVESSDVQ